MVFLDDSDIVLKAVVRSINATSFSWRLGALSSKWVFVNGSIPNNTWVNGYHYNGTVSSVNDTIIVQRKYIKDVGTLPIDTFVYLMISIVVILTLLALPNCKYIIRLLLGNDTRFGTDRTTSRMSKYAFDRYMNTVYPPPRPAPLPSYQETTTWIPGNKVEASDIRDCQSMLRKIYGLRVDVSNAADVSPAHQEIVANWRRQATAGLRDVQGTVERWAQQRDWTAEEKAKVDTIRQRILAIQPDRG